MEGREGGREWGWKGARGMVGETEGGWGSKGPSDSDVPVTTHADMTWE